MISAEIGLVEAIAEAVMAKMEKFAGMKRRLLDIEEAADYLGMSTVALRHECACGGELHIVRIDSAPRFDRRELDRYLDRHPVPAEKSKEQVSLEAAMAAIRRRPRRRGWVYFVASGESAIKVGVARDEKARLKALQIGNPVPLKLLAVVPGDGDTELRLHRAFSDYRISGEWFRLEGPVKELVERIAGGR